MVLFLVRSENGGEIFAFALTIGISFVGF